MGMGTARVLLAAGCAMALLMLVGVQPASAATEVGSNCEGDGGFAQATVIPLATAPGSPLPITAPADGVVTRWKVNSPFPAPRPHVMEVFRPTPAPAEFTLVAQSAIETVMKGPNGFDTRIPVLAGDRFGLYGTPPASITITCESEALANVTAHSLGTVVPGTTQAFAEDPGFQVPVVAVVEPDADKDGYGDETQDGCPQSTELHSACPVLALDSVAQVGRGSVVLLVSSSIEVPVSVSATVKLAGRRKARAAAQARLSGGTKTVTPGHLGRFTLKFPKTLKAALAALPPSRSLKLRATATASSLGRVATDNVSVKLKAPGQP